MVPKLVTSGNKSFKLLSCITRYNSKEDALLISFKVIMSKTRNFIGLNLRLVNNLVRVIV